MQKMVQHEFPIRASDALDLAKQMKSAAADCMAGDKAIRAYAKVELIDNNGGENNKTFFTFYFTERYKSNIYYNIEMGAKDPMQRSQLSFYLGCGKPLVSKDFEDLGLTKNYRGGNPMNILSYMLVDTHLARAETQQGDFVTQAGFMDKYKEVIETLKSGFSGALYLSSVDENGFKKEPHKIILHVEEEQKSKVDAEKTTAIVTVNNRVTGIMLREESSTGLRK